MSAIQWPPLTTAWIFLILAPVPVVAPLRNRDDTLGQLAVYVNLPKATNYRM